MSDYVMSLPISNNNKGKWDPVIVDVSFCIGVTGKAIDITVLRLRHQAACDHGPT